MTEPRGTASPPPADRRGYARTVLAGLGATALLTLACGQDWAGASDPAHRAVTATVTGSQSAPLAIALALVALASWGVVLVLRRRLRRVVCVVGGSAAAGSLVSVVAAYPHVRSDAAAQLLGGVRGDSQGSLTVWYAVAVVAAVVTVVSFVAAWRGCSRWPEMGTRYDAPAARAEAPTNEQDLWRALDAGVDPTSGRAP